MILWILALIVLACVGVVGYYQGAVRVACSFVGLLIAAPLAVPLSAAVKPIFRLMGVDHPVSLAIVAPIIVFIVLMAGVKAGALALHKRIDTHFKYRASDTEQLLFERFQQRVGVAISVANGFIYIVLLSIVFYIWGYFSVQLSTAENRGLVTKIVTQLAKDIQSTKMGKAISSFVPAPEKYYDSVDILGDIYQNPELKMRLASYPAFMGLAEGSDFVALGKDKDFQKDWMQMNPRPRLKKFLSNEKIQPLVEKPGFYTNVLGLLNNDLKDFKTYLESGKSPKYDDQIFLGYWYYNFSTTLQRAQRGKLNMAPLEKIKLRQTLGVWTNAILTVYADNKVSLKLPAETGSAAQTFLGTWKEENPANFTLALKQGNKDEEVPAALEQNRLILRKDNNVLVFEH